jgi:superfamily II DNA or RNA helicase
MLLTFTPDCAHAVLSGRVSTQILSAIDRALTFNEPSAHFDPAFKHGKWDGKTHLFDHEHQIIPSGLVHRVLPVLGARGIDVDIEDSRPKPPWGDTPPTIVTTLLDEKRGTITLESDQQAAVEAAFDRLIGCVEAATSFGKTEVAGAILKSIAPARGIMIADRRALVEQTRARLEERLGERVGLYRGETKETNRRVTAVIYDEAHRVGDMASTVLQAIPAPMRIGLSATIKEAGRRMVVESYLGPIIFEEDLAELVALGRAAMPHVSMLRIDGELAETEADHVYAYWHGIVVNKIRNNLMVDAMRRCIERELPFLTLCVRLEHGRILADKCERTGFRIPFLRGGMSLTETVRDIDAGRLPGVIMSTVGDEGIDMPNVRAGINAGGQRSPLRVMQRLGRTVRKKHEGENAIDFLDTYDTTHRNLLSQADDRRKTYARKKMTPRLISSLDEWLRRVPRTPLAR